MTRRQLWIWGIVVFAFLVVLANTLFIVDQRQSVLVVRFGEPVRVINALGKGGPGLNVKTPFLDRLIRFDSRNIGLEADQEEVISADQERLVVDAFLRYRISDPLQYYRTLRDDRTAAARLEPLVNSALRQVLGSTTSTNIISGQRAGLMAQTKADVARRAEAGRFGIEVIDLRIKRADLPAANQAAVYRRMQTARQQEAAQIRAVGEQQKREIIAGADKEVAITLATATETAEGTRGEGDAQRKRIIPQGYGRDRTFAAVFSSKEAN
jgi:membrane protease subunit HflC